MNDYSYGREEGGKRKEAKIRDTFLPSTTNLHAQVHQVWTVNHKRHKKKNKTEKEEEEGSNQNR